MVRGIEKFREYFKGFPKSYIVIGGTACDIIIEGAGLKPRATKDFDITLKDTHGCRFLSCNSNSSVGYTFTIGDIYYVNSFTKPGNINFINRIIYGSYFLAGN